MSLKDKYEEKKSAVFKESLKHTYFQEKKCGLPWLYDSIYGSKKNFKRKIQSKKSSN